MGVERLESADCGVDEGEFCGRGARVDGPVEVDDAGGGGVREEGVLLAFAWMGGGFAGWCVVASWSTIDVFQLGLQPFPGFEGDVAVEGVGEMLHCDDALVQDGDLVVGFRARHAEGGEAFAEFLLDHGHVLGIVHGVAG